MQVEHRTSGEGQDCDRPQSPPTRQYQAEKVLRVVLQHRRLIPEHKHLENAPSEACLAPHRSLVEAYVKSQQPIQVIIPAFPAKSSNRDKTLGPLPDLGERLALSRLQELCDRIRDVYPPGADVTLCSDGRVFADLVHVQDTEVDAYRHALHQLIRELGAINLKHFQLDDVYSDRSYETMRGTLVREYGLDLESIRQEVQKGNTELASTFGGICRFLMEDYLRPLANPTQGRLREVCEPLAYRVIQRSNAWSQLVQQRFPHALRLSIHPQSAFSRKIGFMLVPCDDPWGTPWHNVVLIEDGRPHLVPRRQAEKLGATLIYENGRPTHYLLSRSGEAC